MIVIKTPNGNALINKEEIVYIKQLKKHKEWTLTIGFKNTDCINLDYYDEEDFIDVYISLLDHIGIKI